MAGVSEHPARHPEAKEKAMEKGKVKVLTSLDLNDNKAGMAGLDREKINTIIMEASKGSRFYENEQKKQRQMLARIEEQKAKVKLISSRQVEEGVRQADAFLASLDASRDLSRTIVHVDMDAFFAAVEMLSRPELRDRPMAVGSNYMLSTSNYAARRFGVRAAMPGFIGKKLCPDLVILPPNYHHYTEVSQVVRQVFVQYDPHFCPMSLDEAYLDLTDHVAARAALQAAQRTYAVPAWDEAYCQCRLGGAGNDDDVPGRTEGSRRLSHSRVDGGPPSNSCSIPTSSSNPELEVGSRAQGTTNDNETGTGTSGSESPRTCGECGKAVYDATRALTRTFGVDVGEAVREMRFRIYCRTRLTASAGIAPNMMLAKVCSDRNKPNGQYMIPPCKQTIREFMHDLPIRKVSGIGKVTESLLSALDVSVCSDLRRQRGLLVHLFSNISYQYFMRVAAGVGATKVESDSERKSMSVERTFGTMSCVAAMLEKCRELSEALVADLRTANIRGKTVAIKLKTINFEVRTRAQSLPECTMDVDVISRAAESLLRAEMKQDPTIQLRLMGVRMSNFASASSPTKSSAQTTLTKLFSKTGPEEVSINIAKSADPKPEECLPKGQKTACDSKNTSIINPTFMDDVDGDSDDAVYEMDTDVEDFSQPLESDMLNDDFGVENRTSLPPKNVELNYGNSERMSVDPSPSSSKLACSTFLGAPNSTVSSTLKYCDEDYTCPICWECINCSDLSDFNNHIDSCLALRNVNDEHSATTFENDSEVKNDTRTTKSVDTTKMLWEKSKSATAEKLKKSSKDKQVKIGDSFRFSWSQTATATQCPSSGSKISSDHVVRRNALENIGGKEFESSVDVRNLKSDFFSRLDYSESNEVNCNQCQQCEISKEEEEEERIGERQEKEECRKYEGLEEGRIEEEEGRRRREEKDRLQCPICGRVQVVDDLPLFNRHVDLCLQAPNKRKSSLSSQRKPAKKKARR